MITVDDIVRVGQPVVGEILETHKRTSNAGYDYTYKYIVKVIINNENHVLDISKDEMYSLIHNNCIIILQYRFGKDYSLRPRNYGSKQCMKRIENVRNYVIGAYNNLVKQHQGDNKYKYTNVTKATKSHEIDKALINIKKENRNIFEVKVIEMSTYNRYMIVIIVDGVNIGMHYMNVRFKDNDVIDLDDYSYKYNTVVAMMNNLEQVVGQLVK